MYPPWRQEQKSAIKSPPKVSFTTRGTRDAITAMVIYRVFAAGAGSNEQWWRSYGNVRVVATFSRAVNGLRLNFPGPTVASSSAGRACAISQRTVLATPFEVLSWVRWRLRLTVRGGSCGNRNGVDVRGHSWSSIVVDVGRHAVHDGHHGSVPKQRRSRPS